jgi:hypothetical protein
MGSGGGRASWIGADVNTADKPACANRSAGAGVSTGMGERAA